MIINKTSLEPFDFEGLEICDYTARRDTSSSLAEITIPSGVQHREAWSRRSDKYYYVVSGTVRFIVDGEAHQLDPGDCCIVLQGHRFSYENTTTETAKIILIHTPSFDLKSEVFV
jgi:mannose-6-phosphate isomerase-like protein (cupin superfamily)